MEGGASRFFHFRVVLTALVRKGALYVDAYDAFPPDGLLTSGIWSFSCKN